jgi:hypothetical protein
MQRCVQALEAGAADSIDVFVPIIKCVVVVVEAPFAPARHTAAPRHLS